MTALRVQGASTPWPWGFGGFSTSSFLQERKRVWSYPSPSRGRKGISLTLLGFSASVSRPFTEFRAVASWSCCDFTGREAHRLRVLDRWDPPAPWASSPTGIFHLLTGNSGVIIRQIVNYIHLLCILYMCVTLIYILCLLLSPMNTNLPNYI